jgi:DNA-binding NarL/FixJ family response regulator
MIAALLVTEMRLNQECLSAALERDGRVRIVAATTGSDDLAKVSLGFSPAVVLLQLSLPKGLLVSRAILRTNREMRIVALDVPEDERSIVAWAEAGVSGCVGQHDCLTDLIDVVDRVARGEVSCSRSISAILFRRAAAMTKSLAELPELPRLTSREIEVLHLIGHGLSNKQIAATLVLEVSTVKNHVHRVFDKLGIHKRADASSWSVFYNGQHVGPIPPIAVRLPSGALEA